MGQRSLPAPSERLGRFLQVVRRMTGIDPESCSGIGMAEILAHFGDAGASLDHPDRRSMPKDVGSDRIKAGARHGFPERPLDRFDLPSAPLDHPLTFPPLVGRF